MIRRAAAAVTRCVVVVLALASCKGDSEHLDRARTLMSNGQWANARTALGQVLAERERDTTARGLLLYCLDHEEGLARIAELGLHPLYYTTVALDAPAWGHTSKELRTWIETAVTDARKALFDRGIDTQDGPDLVAVIVSAARFGFEHEKDPERRDLDAAILALHGDSAALTHLIERLKSQDPDAVIDHLVDVGAPALPGLRRVIDDKNFIGRQPARAAMARVLAGERAREMVTEHPGLRSPTGAESTLPGRARLGSSVLSMVRHPGVLHVHGQYLALQDGAEDGLVLLQSWNDRKDVLVLELHAVRGGSLHRLGATSKGAPFELGEGSAVFGLAAERGAIVLRRVRERTLSTEIETGRVAQPGPGMRVRLRGQTPHGVILREDEGLWVVKMDAPIEGMTELPVATSSLIGLRPERRTETAIETITGVVKHDALEVRSTNLAIEEDHD